MATTVIIPAFNEEDRIAATVQAAASIDGVAQVIVVDDGSHDATAARAREAGAFVIIQPANRGKGAALEAALQMLEDQKIVVFLDADLGNSASEAAKLIAPLQAGEAHMAIAVLPRPAKKAGFGLVRGAARDAIRELGGGFEAQAPLSGQRAITGECLQALRPIAPGFGVEVALTVRALQRGFKVTEVQTNISHRATGNNLAGILHRARQYRDVRRTIKELRKA
jgi:glycosyltransferase involved in cell wall biosynthesis